MTTTATSHGAADDAPAGASAAGADAASAPMAGADPAGTTATAPVLQVENVTKRFSVGRGASVHALEPTSLSLRPSTITALVGESGSGKSTLAWVMAGLHKPTSGRVLLHGEPISIAKRAQLRAYHSKVQLILQDPFASLNPAHRIRHILSVPLRSFHHGLSGDDLEKALHALMERVNLTPPETYLDKFPYELSGGQRQRVSIARGLAVEPEVILGDEPVSMLDVSIRLDILNLLAALRDEGHLAILYVTHDIASARYFADDVAVLYAGQMVEYGPSDQVVEAPMHPYTRLLLDASPDPDRPHSAESSEFGSVADAGEPPSLIDPPPGCRFHPRCPLASEECRRELPAAQGSKAHWARCWRLFDDASSSGV